MLRVLLMISNGLSRLLKCPSRLATGMFLLFALVAGGCYYEDAYYENAGTDYTTVNNHDLLGDLPLDNRMLEGIIDVPSKVFTPTRATLTVLDSALHAEDSLNGKLAMSRDTVRYMFPSNDYIFPYVKIAVEGRWRMPDSTEEIVAFETISDISEVSSPRVGVMTHVEIPMLKRLVKEGYPFKAAKRVAMRELEETLGFSHESVGLPAESYGRAFDEEAFIYAFSMRGGSGFKKNLKSFRDDLADASLDDSVAFLEFADFIISEWLSVDSLLNAMGGNGSTRKWFYFKKAVEKGYGLEGGCETGDVVTVGKKKSKFYGDSLICDYTYYTHFLRQFLDNEKRFGPCVMRDPLDKIEVLKMDDSLVYACFHRAAQFGLSKDSTHMEFQNDWFVTEHAFLRDYHLGTCNSDKQRKQAKYLDTIYVCMYTYSAGDYVWRVNNTDTLTYFLGKCEVSKLWDLEMLEDSTEFVCTPDSWKAVTDSLRFLARQRPCDREKDSLRVMSFDTTYYVCGDLDKYEFKVYSFMETTKAYADSLLFLATLPECSKLADTVKYAVDTLSGRYYHCEIRGNVLKFYDSDLRHAESYLNEQFANSLPACTAQSDTLELFVHPYFEKTRDKDWNTYYHCANVDGKYQYEALDYVKRRILEGLVDVNARFTCDANTDTLSVVRDTLYGNYYHCEKNGDQYGFVSITVYQANEYMSSMEARNFEACELSDTISYFKDKYGIYYMCAEDGDTTAYKQVSLDSLKGLLTAEFVAQQEPCDASVQRWRLHSKSILSNAVYLVCDYDLDSNFALFNVNRPYAIEYQSRRNAADRTVTLNACSEEQLAARGPEAEVQGDYMTDPRDGRRYRVTTIGKQTWMAENLNYSDSVATPNLKGRSGCSEKAEECEKTGRLYYWNAVVDVPADYDRATLPETICAPVQGICPAGWHVPMIEEWSQLFLYVMYNNGGLGYGVGLKAETDWYALQWYKQADQFGFSAAPVTWTQNQIAYFATAETRKSGLQENFEIKFEYGSGYPTLYSEGGSRTYSVRCVKD